MNNNFSAFKLFFDEFIYKKNSFVSYVKVEENIATIIELIEKVRKQSKLDIKAYMSNLNKANKKMREQLDIILKNNKALMESFLLMYKTRVANVNDSISDMPFIISNSFYNDYRLDDKSPLELEMNNNTIPKYSSLEKKQMREETKDLPAFSYFVQLLMKSDNHKKYDFFIEKAKVILSLEPLYNETHFIYFDRVYKLIDGYDKSFKKLEEKAKLTDDYEDISLRMKIAYRKKMENWESGIEEMISEYFDYLFNKKESNAEIRKYFNVVNKISYSSYTEVIKDLSNEKAKLEKAFENNEYRPVSYYGDSYLLKFREVMINSYFDNRYRLNIIKGDIDSYVDAAINLYSLAIDVENSIFNYYIYLASHSRRLLRNNDVESAIIANIYSLYSPLLCLERFEKARREFGSQLNMENNTFKKKYNTALLTKRVEYGFKGMIPNIAAINIKLNESCKKFVVENCLENITNFDQTGLYDTRNYDLEVMCAKLNFDEIVELYERLKAVFNNFPDSNMIPQKFICEVIYNRLRYDDCNESDKKEKLKEISMKYLKEEALFV
ncbi:MAG: hypothetical protein II625_08690 [Bacilli bacterium]|nr:hypothetical protein [Bacilli bacterium]